MRAVRRSALVVARSLALVAVYCFAPAAAHAEAPDRATCLDAYVAGQDARKSGALRAARSKLEICTDASCPGMIQRDCARWLDEVDHALPSVVLAVRDSAGHDLLDATATLDGGPARLDGRVIALDPGKHTLVVRSRSDERREELLLVAGEHDRSVVVVFPSSSSAESALSSRNGSPSLAPPRVESSPRPVPVASWVLGGLGVAALGTFGIAAASGASDRTSLGCDRGCSSASYESVNRQFLIADVGLGAGLALIGSAVVWWLVDRMAATSSRPGRQLLGGTL